jgi:ADP-ribosyl-[dinitrogen reductase] hydrolase
VVWVTPEFVDRTRGVLVGLAVGDALGAPVEFDEPMQIVPRRDELFMLPGGGVFNWAPGEFTDDTQMALVLARHLERRDGALDQDELAREFAEWARSAADVGNQTRSVLSLVARGDDWRAAVDSLSPTAEGNGALMRVAPVALVAGARDQVLALARTQSEVTHPNATCKDASAAYAWLVRRALDTGEIDLAGALEVATEASVREAIERSQARESPVMSGWVIHTLTSALWAVAGADSFEDAVWRAVSLGKDADTVGAIAGALAGARWGLTDISNAWASQLQSRHRDFVGEYPGALIALADALRR